MLMLMKYDLRQNFNFLESSFIVHNNQVIISFHPVSMWFCLINSFQTLSLREIWKSMLVFKGQNKFYV